MPQHGRHPEVKELLALPLQLQMPSRERLGMSRNLAKEPLIRGGFRRTEMGDRPRRDRRLVTELQPLPLQAKELEVEEGGAKENPKTNQVWSSATAGRQGKDIVQMEPRRGV